MACWFFGKTRVHYLNASVKCHDQNECRLYCHFGQDTASSPGALLMKSCLSLYKTFT